MALAANCWKVLVNTFHADGFDPVTKTLDGSSFDYESVDGYAFISDPLTVLSAFLGLPNKRLARCEPQSWENIGKNLIGWHAERSLVGKLFLMPLLTLIHLIALPLKLFRNLLKLVVVAVPGIAIQLLSELTGIVLSPVLKRMQNEGVSSLGPLYIPDILTLLASLLVLAPLLLVFNALRLIGRAITSPFNFVRSGWYLGLGLQVYGMKPDMAKIFAVFFTILATLVVILTYTLLLPLLAKTLALTVLQHLPTAIQGALHTLSLVFGPTLTMIGRVTLIIFDYITPVFQVSAMIGGLSEFAALGMLTAVTLLLTAPLVHYSELLFNYLFFPEPSKAVITDDQQLNESTESIISSLGPAPVADSRLGNEPGHYKLFEEIQPLIPSPSPLEREEGSRSKCISGSDDLTLYPK